MIAFHGDERVKATYLARVRAHAAADELIHGTYWEKGKGCAIGCTVHGSNHMAYESELGIPAQLAYLEDRLFESLPNGEAQTWPVRFLEAIPVGADLSMVWPQFVVWLLTDPTDGVIRFAEGYPDAQAVIQRVAALYERGMPAARAARAAEAAAGAAAERTCYLAQATSLLSLLSQAPVVVRAESHDHMVPMAETRPGPPKRRTRHG